jgi:hypothetical protein
MIQKTTEKATTLEAMQTEPILPSYKKLQPLLDMLNLTVKL